MPAPLIRTEIIPARYVERHSRKGWLQRDFFINNVRYKWLSSGVMKDGLVRYGMRADAS